ncbi:MAG TPA: hypothetical protein VIC62_02390 [Nakamurella sp.]
MSQIIPIVLIGLGGFLIGGVISVRRKSVPAAIVLGVFAAACIVGGIAWLLS